MNVSLGKVLEIQDFYNIAKKIYQAILFAMVAKNNFKSFFL
jgi:hypothetical protein